MGENLCKLRLGGRAPGGGQGESEKEAAWWGQDGAQSRGGTWILTVSIMARGKDTHLPNPSTSPIAHPVGLDCPSLD